MRRKARQKIVIYCISFFIGIILFRYMTTKEIDWDNMDPSINNERALRKVAKHDKWIVVTSIQYPTHQLKELLKIPGWKLIVVGDRKSPRDWKLPGAIYLDTAAQKDLKYRTHKFLPYDSYTRKAIGYLYAIEHGATFIYETDDDNNPSDGLKLFHTSSGSSVGALVADTKKNLTFNPYPHFGQSTLWPRGYPLEYIGTDQPRVYRACSTTVPAVQQGLVDGDPDVDAIFRLTRKHSDKKLDLKFDGAAPPVILPKGVFAPYNTQNTLVTARAFWSLILPVSVKFRACDIYRSYWAQRLMWLTDSHVAFYPPTSVQRRNPHSHIADAIDEAEIYQNMGRYVKFLSQWKCKEIFFFDCVRKLTAELVTVGFLQRQDLDLIDAWVTDLSTIGYLPPALKLHPEICSAAPENQFLFYPWEQNTTMFNSPQNVPMNELQSSVQDRTYTVSKYCGGGAAYHVSKAAASQYSEGENILLVVTVHSTDVIPMIDAVYQPYFPHILYCGKQTNLQALEQTRKVSYISPIGAVNAVSCLNRAIRLGYAVEGYLHISASMFLQAPSLHVSSRNKGQVWVMGDPQVYKPHIIEQCNEKSFRCVGLSLKKLADIEKGIENLQVGSNVKLKIKQCFTKVSQDENLKHNTGVEYLRDPAFHLPSRLTSSFKNMLGLMDVDGADGSYSFLIFLIMQCMEIVPEYLHSVDIEDVADTDHVDIISPFDFENIILKMEYRKAYCDYMEKM